MHLLTIRTVEEALPYIRTVWKRAPFTARIWIEELLLWQNTLPSISKTGTFGTVEFRKCLGSVWNQISIIIISFQLHYFIFTVNTRNISAIKYILNILDFVGTICLTLLAWLRYNIYAVHKLTNYNLNQNISTFNAFFFALSIRALK